MHKKNERAFWGHTKNALEKKEGKWSKLKNGRAAPSNFKIQFLAPSIYIGLIATQYQNIQKKVPTTRFSASAGSLFFQWIELNIKNSTKGKYQKSGQVFF